MHTAMAMHTAMIALRIRCRASKIWIKVGRFPENFVQFCTSISEIKAENQSITSICDIRHLFENCLTLQTLVSRRDVSTYIRSINMTVTRRNIRCYSRLVVRLKINANQLRMCANRCRAMRVSARRDLSEDVGADVVVTEKSQRAAAAGREAARQRPAPDMDLAV
jgi:hypothetical protein